jgi:hypothetical protein
MYTGILKYVRGRVALEKSTGKPFPPWREWLTQPGFGYFMSFLSQKVDSKHV